MTRPWGAVYGSMLTHRKYLRSSHEERSAWLTLFLYALNSPSDERLGCLDDLVAMLRPFGHKHPAALVESFVALGWLDLEDGSYTLHDWEEWQPADPTGAARKRVQRERSHRTVTGQSQDSHRTTADGHVTVTGVSRSTGHKSTEQESTGENYVSNVGTNSQATLARTNGNGHFDGPADDLQTLMASWRILGVPLSPKETVRLDRLVEVHGIDAVRCELERIHGDPKMTTSRQYVLGAENVLNEIPTGNGARQAATEAREASAAARREQRGQAYLEDFGPAK